MNVYTIKLQCIEMSTTNEYNFINYYLKLIGIITAALGLFLLILPSFSAGIFFQQINTSTEFFTRITGSTLLGYATLNIIASHYSHSEVLRGAVWGNLTTLTAATMLSILYIHQIDDFGWLLVLQHAVFTLGFVFCAYILQNPKL